MTLSILPDRPDRPLPGQPLDSFVTTANVTTAKICGRLLAENLVDHRGLDPAAIRDVIRRQCLKASESWGLPAEATDAGIRAYLQGADEILWRSRRCHSL